MSTSAACIDSIISQKVEHDTKREPFFVVNLETIVEKFRQWRETLPMVVPYYAVKCNPNPGVLQTLARLGTGFDCASKNEIDTVMGMGVTQDRILFANPCKMESQIMHAREVNVKRMTFDNADELRKIARLYPDAQLILRIITDDSHSMCRFSVKFGASMKDVPSLLKLAVELELDLMGVSFHVGSGCGDPVAFAQSASDALQVFKWGTELGLNMRLLDLGGGFQGTDFDTPTLSDIARVLVPVLQQFPQGTEFVAEPGRYFAMKSHTLCCNIFARRVVRDENGAPTRFVYYINDGVYQSFNCIFFDHQHPQPKVLPRAGIDDTKLYSTMIFGPTCDSLDCITKEAMLPELKVGDWLYFENMGAYTSAAHSR